jgi:hypothetical protein
MAAHYIFQRFTFDLVRLGWDEVGRISGNFSANSRAFALAASWKFSFSNQSSVNDAVIGAFYLFVGPFACNPLYFSPFLFPYVGYARHDVLRFARRKTLPHVFCHVNEMFTVTIQEFAFPSRNRHVQILLARSTAYPKILPPRFTGQSRARGPIWLVLNPSATERWGAASYVTEEVLCLK